MKQVVETTNGTIWVRTVKGLAWYDDFRWHPIRIPGRWEDSGDVTPDLEGGVLATIDGLVFRVDEEGFEPVALPHVARDRAPLRALPLPRGDGLLLVTTNELFRLTRGELTPIPSPHSDDRGSFAQFHAGGDGAVWYLSDRSGQGVLEWEGDSWQQRFPFLATNFVTEGDETLVGVNQAAAVNGVWSIPPVRDAQPTRFPGENASSIPTAMDLGERGEGIIVYRSGRVCVRRDGSWKELEPVPLELENAHALLFQDNGDLWAANKQGLFLHRASSTRWLRRSTGELSVEEINALLPTPSGDLWLGTPNGIRIRRADDTVEHIESILGTDLGIVTGLLREESGAIWVSSGADFPGAYRFFEGRWKHFGAEEGLRAQRVHRIVSDRRGRLWFLGISPEIGVDEPGAYVFDGTSFTAWGVPQGLRNGRVFSFVEDDDGALWFGTLGHLSRWRDGSWTHWSSDRCRFFSLAVHAGRTWFGALTRLSGLGFVDERDELRFLSKADGMVSNRIWDLQSEPGGALWIGTNNGVSRFHDGRFSSFSRDSGLAHPRVWPLSIAEDRVYIGTIGGGVYELGLEEVGLPAPVVELVDPLLDTESALFRWQVHPYRSSPHQIETRFRIDDAPWSTWSKQRETKVLGLAAGEHEFEVQAKSRFGALSSQTARATVDVSPPLYRHPLLMVGVGLWLTTMVSVGVIHLRRKRNLLESKLTSEQRLRTLVDEIPLCIHEVDLQGRVMSMNPAGVAMLGLPTEAAVIGRDYLGLVNEDDRGRIEGCLELARDGHTSRYSFRGRGAAGEDRVFASSIAPVRDASGTVTRLMGHTQDITDDRRAEQERLHLERQLRQAHKMEAIGQLAGGVAHDFNNILTVIGGHAEFLRTTQQEGDATHESVHHIESAVERAASLTHQLLAFSRRQVLQPAVLDVAEVVSEVDMMLRRLINENIEIALEVHPDVGCVEVDRVQFGQVIINLVVNARDAIEGHGKIRVSAFDRRLRDPLERGDTLVPPGHYVVLEVLDTGRGIDAATQSRIFEPFFTTKDLERGTGLGLSTIYGIVTQSEGYVIVESEPGRGARFSVYLPRVARELLVPAKPENSTGDLTGAATVLVAEDDPGIRDLIRHTLERYGYTVLCGSDGAEAVRIAEQHAGSIELLVTDLVMPLLNGSEVARLVTQARPDTAVLFLSGYADREILDQIDDPSTPMLEKPFKFNELLALVRSLLKDRGRPLRSNPLPEEPRSVESDLVG